MTAKAWGSIRNGLLLFLGALMFTAGAQADVDLRIVKDENVDPIASSHTLLYTITVSNSGPDTATGILVTDFLPPEVVVDTLPPGCALVTGTVVCTLGDLAPKGATSMVMGVKAIDPCFQKVVITNRAEVTSAEVDSNPADNTTIEKTTLLSIARVALAKDASDIVRTNQVFNYTLTVFNNGPCDAANLTLTDTLPPQVVVLDAGGGTPTNGALVWSLGNLPNQTTTTLTVQVQAPATRTVLTNRAQLTAESLPNLVRDDPVITRVGSYVVNDFDGDHVADIALFNSRDTAWYFLRSSGGLLVRALGTRESVIVPGDYEGDGVADRAIFDPPSGLWVVNPSRFEQTRDEQQWGYSATTPVPADYDGDGRTDRAVFEPATGNWFVKQSATETLWTQNWGYSLTIPVPGDYDGDGLCDVAVFEPSTGNWYILGSQAGFILQQWGYSATTPWPADYDGDRKTDVAVYEPATGTFFIQGSTAGLMTQQWGYSGTTPVPADYDGDGTDDIAVFEPDTRTWYVLGSSAGMVQTVFDFPGVPVLPQYGINDNADVEPPRRFPRFR